MERTSILTARWRKLYGIANQIPKDLANSDWVGPDRVLGRGKANPDVQFLFNYIVAYYFDNFMEHAMGVDYFKMKLDLTADNARQIEQVINQARFQLDVALNGQLLLLENPEAIAKRDRANNLPAVPVSESAQFVTQERQELIFCLIRLFRCNFGRFHLPNARLVRGLQRVTSRV